MERYIGLYYFLSKLKIRFDLTCDEFQFQTFLVVAL